MQGFNTYWIYLIKDENDAPTQSNMVNSFCHVVMSSVFFFKYGLCSDSVLIFLSFLSSFLSIFYSILLPCLLVWINLPVSLCVCCHSSVCWSGFWLQEGLIYDLCCFALTQRSSILLSVPVSVVLSVNWSGLSVVTGNSFLNECPTVLCLIPKPL